MRENGRVKRVGRRRDWGWEKEDRERGGDVRYYKKAGGGGGRTPGRGLYGGGRYGGGRLSGGRYTGTFQKRVDGMAELHNTHINTYYRRYRIRHLS